MAAPKKRNTNFSSEEKRILTELVLKYQDVVENKRTDATTNSSKLKGWIRIAEEFNTISTFCHRTHAVLKCCWENIKRQTKKDRADRKKKLFMTGGGKPPTPPPSNTESTIVEAILGPALKGIISDFDTESLTFSKTTEWKTMDQSEKLYVIEGDSDYAGISIEDNENIETIVSVVDKHVQNAHTSTAEGLLKERNENIETIVVDKHEQNAHTSTAEGLLKERNDNDTWSSWTPKTLKTPVSGQLKVTKESKEGRLKRRRPQVDCLGDDLVKEKIRLVKILQENAEKESRIRLAILEEQLYQEKIKTQKLKDN